MATYPEFTLAAIQAAPIHFEPAASTEKARGLIAQAADRGTTLAAFGETWLPGYAFTGATLTPLRWYAHAAYVANAVTIPGPETEQLCAAAKSAGIDVAIGVAEPDERTRAPSTALSFSSGATGAFWVGTAN